MQVLIEAPFSLTNEVKKSIEEDLKDLGKYDDKITRAEIYFKMDDGDEPDVVLAEVQLHVPGPVIFASETNVHYRTALNAAIAKAKRQLLKAKSIRQDHHPSS